MVDYIVNRIFNSVTYIVPINGQKDCYLVDCGDVELIISQGWQIKSVLLTHVHTDHIYGLNKLIDSFPNVSIYTNEYGKEALLNPKLNFSRYHEDVDDFIITRPDNVVVIKEEGLLHLIGGNEINVLFTPGHDPSCLSYCVGGIVFTGDSYIPDVKIVTSLPKSKYFCITVLKLETFYSQAN